MLQTTTSLSLYLNIGRWNGEDVAVVVFYVFLLCETARSLDMVWHCQDAWQLQPWPQGFLNLENLQHPCSWCSIKDQKVVEMIWIFSCPTCINMCNSCFGSFDCLQINQETTDWLLQNARFSLHKTNVTLFAETKNEKIRIRIVYYCKVSN